MFSQARQLRHIAIILLYAGLSGCGKDKLTGDYAVLKGKYEWRSTGLITGSALSSTHGTLQQGDVPYTVHFELNDKGEALFYKDGALLSRNRYTIQDKENNSGTRVLLIKLKGSHGMNLDEDKLSLSLSGDTALTINRFPFPAIDDAGNYKKGFRSLDNRFNRD
jgi:hypothetical protein